MKKVSLKRAGVLMANHIKTGVAAFLVLAMGMHLMADTSLFESRVVALQRERYGTPTAQDELATGLSVESKTREFAKKCLSEEFSQQAAYASLLDEGGANIGRLSCNAASGVNDVFTSWVTPNIQRPLYWISEGYETQAEVDLDAVQAFVRTYILKRTAGRYEVTGTSAAVGSEVVVKGAFFGKPHPSPFEKSFIVFIDDNAGGNWGHPCRYVFVKDDLSAFAVWFASEPISVEGVELVSYFSSGIQSAPMSGQNVLKMMSSNGSSTDGLSYAGDASKSYALIISGGGWAAKNFARYWGDVAMFYSTLRLKYGIPKANITVCMADGTSTDKDRYWDYKLNTSGVLVESKTYDSSPVDLDNDGQSDINYSATKANIKSAISSLAAKLTASDQLFVFITDHGDKDGDTGVAYLIPWLGLNKSSYTATDIISVSELSSWISAIKAPTALAFEFCYSGCFISSIRSQSNRVVATACGDEDSNAFLLVDQTGVSSDNYAYNGYPFCNPWAWAFNAAIRGCDSSWRYPWNDDSGNLVGNADSDGNGEVSFYEAAQKAEDFILNTTTVGSTSGRTLTFGDTPQYGESTSGLGKKFYILKQTTTDATLTSLTITGDSSIVGGSSALYTCKANYSDGSSKAVSPTWSVTSGSAYASFSSSLVSSLLNTKTVTSSQSATIQASYTEDGVTKTVTKTITITPSSPVPGSTTHTLSIPSAGGSGCSVSFTIASAGSYVFAGGTADGVPDWLTSMSTKTVSGGITITLGKSHGTQTLAASTVVTVTVAAGANTTGATRSWDYLITGANESHTVRISQPSSDDRTLTSISISGSASVTSGSQSTYACTASYSDGTSSTVTPTWSITSGSTYATISSSGVLTAKTVTSSQSVTIKASYTYGSVTKTATKTITVTPSKVLTSISISGSASVTSGSQSTYACTASYSDGSSATVTPTWSITSGSTYATISSSGVLTAKTVTSSQSVTIKASYTSGSVTKTATKTITITASPTPTPPDWDVATGYENWQTIYAKVYDKTSKAYLTHSSALLAAFDQSGTCIGKANITAGILLFQLNAGFNGSSISGVTLKYWDPTTGIIDVPGTISLTSSSDIGDVTSPRTFEVGEVELSIALNQNYTWISIPLVLEDSSIATVFSNLGFANGDKIAAPGCSASYLNGTWYLSPSTFTVSPGVTYVVRRSASGTATLNVSGTAMTPSTSVVAGWNWIGSLSPTDVALADISHSSGFVNSDKCNGQGSGKTAAYLNGTWYGSMTTLTPGVGYKFKLANAGTLSTTEGNSANGVNLAGTTSNGFVKSTTESFSESNELAPDWVATTGYENWQTIYAKIYDETSKAYLTHSRALLAAFDESGTCIGKASITEGLLLFQLNAGFNGSSISGVTLKYWDPTTGIIKVPGTISMTSSTDVGDIMNPVTYNVQSTTPTTTHTVTFSLGTHGSRTGGGALVQTVSDGAAATAPTVTASTGYTFTGWNKTFSSVKSDMTVTAQYSPISYTITYANTKGASNPNPVSYTIESATITFSALSGVSGYTFTGWSPASIAKGSTGNKTITAQWKTDPDPTTYTVTYAPGKYGKESQQTATKTQGVALTLKGAIFTRSGYTQTGWSTSDGGAKAYALGASYTANAAVTLYPVWTPVGDAYSDGVYSMTVDGVEWTFTIVGGTARVDNVEDTGTVRELTIPSAMGGCPVTCIGSYAFVWCEHLTTVTIPICVTNVAECAFTQCAELTAINVAAGNDCFTSIDGVLYNKAKTILLACPNAITSLNIPSSVARIDDYAFSDCTLSRVTIPSGVTSIGWGAFRWCGCLTDITIPNSVTSIENWAFDGCSALKSLTIPSSVTSLGTSNFEYCNALKNVYVDAGDTVRVKAMFAKCGFDYTNVAFVESTPTVKIAKPTTVTGLTYTGGSQTGVAADSRLVLVTGSKSATAAGCFSATYKLPASTSTTTYQWADGTTANVTVGWSIAARSVSDSAVTFASIPSQTYTGSEIRPSVTMTYAGVVRTKGTDYTLSYANNKAVGTASVTVAGKGNFTGTKTLSFTIVSVKPAAPTGVTASQGTLTTEITVRWSQVTGATKYYIYRSTDGKSSSAYNVGVRDGCIFSDTSAVSGVKYYYWVKAYNEAGYSDYSASASGFLQSTIQPGAYAAVGTGCEEMGTVSGGKAAKVGSKLTLRATAKKGYVFAGWYLDPELETPAEGTVDYRSPSFTVYAEEDATTYYARFIPTEEDFVEIYAGAEDEYVRGEAIEPIVIYLEANSLPTVSVSGLPTGLKFTAKALDVKATKTTSAAHYEANTIYGTPTKSGIYTVTIKAKTAGKAAATETLKFIVRADGEAIIDVGYDAECGKVTGMGICAEGKKLTLKATPAKGYVFAGWWYDGTDGLDTVDAGVDYRTTSITVTGDGTDVTYWAQFIPSEEDEEIEAIVSDQDINGYCEIPIYIASSSLPTVTVKGLPTGLKFDAKTLMISGTPTKPGVYTVTVSYKNATVKKALSETFVINVANIQSPYLDVAYETDAYNYYGGVSVEFDIGSCAMDGWTVSTVSGLPSGLRFDTKTGLIKGVPTKGGTFTATVTLKNGKEKSSATITMNVEAIPSWAYGTFNGGSEAGQAQFTISSAGKITGKYLANGITYTLSAPAFTSSDGVAYNADVTAKYTYTDEDTKKKVTASEVWYIQLWAGDAGGCLYGESSDGMCVDAYQNLWSQKDWKALGVTQFGKSGTVKTLLGDDYLLGDDESVTLTIKSTGAVTAKGKFCTSLEDRKGNLIYYTATASAVVCVTGVDPFDSYIYLYFAPNQAKGFEGFAWKVEIQ